LRGRDYKQQILHIHEDQCKCFSSATRAPFLMVYETANLDEVPCNSADSAVDPCQPTADPAEILASTMLDELVAAGAVPAPTGDACVQANSASHSLWGRLVSLTPEEWLGVSASQRTAQPPAAQDPARQGVDDAAQDSAPKEYAACPGKEQWEQASKVRMEIWGESWASRRESIHKSSPFRKYSSWALNAVVVKGGDDLRQELLASQVIKQFSAIFKEARLPLWLKEIEVLVTSASSGCIEFLPDSMSVTGVKKIYPEKSLAEIFKDAFADGLFKAKRNFIESYAAYSLVVWFLQVKDRHNDNLMMLSSGHVVHLDFGFMLSNSPGGNMGFEQSPFKLTQEFLDVMGGEFSDEYEYFRTLVVRGFLEARKHVDRIVLPVRMLLASGSKLPCFRDGLEWVLQTLQDRFFINLTEEACIEKILELIDTSVNNWSTIQYDMYQKFVNGIV